MSKSDFDIQGYLSEGVEVILKDAMMATLKNPKESVYLLKFSKHAKRANRIRQDHNKKGRNIPAFLIASITSSCNLHCTQQTSFRPASGMTYSHRQRRLA